MFRSLSHTALARSDSRVDAGSALASGLEELPFRRPAAGASVHDGPSLLLYYLFDDWHLLYDFVLHRGAPYSTQMRTLRNQMHLDPQLGHLAQLHALSRKLAMLQRMYETRKMIVDNLLTRQENSLKKHQHPPLPPPAAAGSDPAATFAAPLGDPAVLGVPLGALATAKFERLRDRIKLYVLGELDALLAEKAELETLTFNLISLKQSTTVELLTRVTIWLAGFTFVFLPLSLVTGYFSMQLKGFQDKYTAESFWGAAGVAIALTLVVLYTVGKSTGTMKLGTLWRGVKRVWFGWLDNNRKKRNRKQKKSRGTRKTLVG